MTSEAGQITPPIDAEDTGDIEPFDGQALGTDDPMVYCSPEAEVLDDEFVDGNFSGGESNLEDDLGEQETRTLPTTPESEPITHVPRKSK